MPLLPDTRGCVSSHLQTYCCGHPFKSTDVPPQRRTCSASRLKQRSESARQCTCRVHNRHEVHAAGGSNPDDLMSAFSREIANRNEAQERAAEHDEASSFGGRQLLEVLQARYESRNMYTAQVCDVKSECLSSQPCRYGRSYDVALVQRKYLGKVIIAFNVMWKYKEQKSFGVSALLQSSMNALSPLVGLSWLAPAVLAHV